MKIILASDHAGFDLKSKLYSFLKDGGYEVIDYGPHELESDDDYPDFVAPIAEEISVNTNGVFGIIIGGSGQGEAIMANRFSGVRAVVFNGQYEPKDGREVPNEIILSREHNDANILSLGARFLSEEEAKVAVKLWLDTPFSGEDRHKRRIAKIEEYSRRGKSIE